MNLKQRTKSIFLLFSANILMAFSFNANADFYKAYDAFVVNDGKAMLQQISRAAAQDKHDGFMLLLSAILVDLNTSSRQGLYKVYPEKRSSRLETILSQHELKELLVLFIQSSKSEQEKNYIYRLLFANGLTKRSKETREIPNEISSFVNEWLENNRHNPRDAFINRAKKGDPFAQMIVGLHYLKKKDTRKYGCDSHTEKLECFPIDKTKGEYWLKKALYTYESSSHADMNPYYNSMCDVLQNEEDSKLLRQAFQWCWMGISITKQSGSWRDSWRLLDKMYNSGKMKVAMPEIASLYNKHSKNRIELLKAIKKTGVQQTPGWVLQTRAELKKAKLPVFTYYVNDYIQYQIDVYSDGVIKLNKSAFDEVSKKKVTSFFKNLNKIGFYDWERHMDDYTWCDNAHSYHCVIKRYQATVRNGKQIDRLQYFSFPNAIETKYRQEKHKKLAQLYTLVEQYFPTQNYRCKLGLSAAYQKACVARDSFLAKLATEDLTRPKR